MARYANHRAAFTLIEILVSVAVLVVIVLICGQVFQAASAVSRTANASGDILQEAWGIEQQMRADFSRISPDGALVIHSVEVPNDYNYQLWDNTGPRPPLINPALPADAPVRCDQSWFVMDGFERSKSYGAADLWGGPSDGVPRIIGGAAAVTYGHGLQFPELSAFSIDSPSMQDEANSLHGDLPPQHSGHDVDLDDLRSAGNLARVAPFHRSNVTGEWGGRLPTVYSRFGFAGGGGSSALYNQTAPGGNAAEIRGDQPPANQWVLSRQVMAMGDDDSNPPNATNKHIYFSGGYSIESLFPADPRRVSQNQAGFNREAPVHDMGRVDLTAMNTGEIRKALLHSRAPTFPDTQMRRRPWFGEDNADFSHVVLEDEGVLPGDANDDDRGTQRYLLHTMLAWPRVERGPAGAARYDQAVTNGMAGSACSNFIVEWTWDDDIGQTRTWEKVDPTNPSSRKNRVTWQGWRYDRSEVDVDDLPNASSEIAFDGSGGEVEVLRQKGDIFWFGLPDKRIPGDEPDKWDRGVVSFAQFAEAFPGPDYPWPTPDGVLQEDDKVLVASPSLVHPRAIDGEEPASAFPGQPVVREYWATFGANARWPLLRGRDLISGAADPDTQSAGLDGRLDPDPSYTPWPSALRISMILHDPGSNIEQGKLVQYVIELPKERFQ
jgi:type II secretory pathway pseudopilin PulG